jgi:hypothetical protein
MKDASVHIQMLKDILLDLTDEGCYVNIFPTPIAFASEVEPDIYVRLELDVDEEETEQNRYSVEDKPLETIYPAFDESYKRMVSYMDSVGWGHNVTVNTRGGKRNRERDHTVFYKMDVRFFRK